MRIAHTSDWHMGKRLGFVDRSDDIKRGIRQIAGTCTEQQVDVLLVCGDLFDGNTRPELVRDWMEFLNQTFNPFLRGGGTILALTGNHDNEHLAQVLRQAMQLASPTPNEAGGLLKPGRLYLFAGPTFFRMSDPTGTEVQFIMMPSPTVARYLTGETQKFNSIDERNRALKAAFTQRLVSFASEPAYDKGKHTLLAAHIPVCGAAIASGHTLSESDVVLLQEGELPTGYAYVALGDIHRPQTLMNLPHVRYCGSIDRMDMGEADEEKGIVLVDIGGAGRMGEPRWVKLDVTPIYRINIQDPDAQMHALAEQYPDRQQALVHLTIHHRPGHHNLPDLLAKLAGVFPRCYAREYAELNGHVPAAGSNGHGAPTPHVRTVQETVRDYLNRRLAEHADREALLSLADQLLMQDNA